MLSVLDIFKIGVGPSSSHTVGPMLIARRFLVEARAAGVFDQIARVEAKLCGSLGFTGLGHGSDRAVLLGLMGETPDGLDIEAAEARLKRVRSEGRLTLLGERDVAFDAKRDVLLRGEVLLDAHPNGLQLAAFDTSGAEIFAQTYFSIGGGAIRRDDEMGQVAESASAPAVAAFTSGEGLLKLGAARGVAIADIMLEAEEAWRPREATLAGLDRIWDVMAACIVRGLATEGVLPGGLEVKRRAPALYRQLMGPSLRANERETLFDWLNVYALAVNEENAAGGRVVTAPTNGAAGIIPSVIMHYCATPEINRSAIRAFLLNAGAIGLLYKANASISGAEMGCQGEVGVACSMAAAGLTAVWGGSNEQIEHAAEIGMEHHLGLTCDPVKGLVQIPCIERNAFGAVKAVNAARLALTSTGDHKVSLDQVIETMRQTGIDMNSKYKETSQGGLAVNVVEC